MDELENEHLKLRDALRYGQVYTDVTGKRIDPLTVEGAVSDAVAAVARRIEDEARSYLPAMSLYYHTGVLPRDDDGNIVRR